MGSMSLLSYLWLYVPKALFEIWEGWNPSLNHLYVCVCQPEVKVYKPHQRKLHSKTQVFALNIKEYWFIISHIDLKIEARNAIFFQVLELIGSIL